MNGVTAIKSLAAKSGVWSGYLAVLLLLPQLFDSILAISIFNQMAIAIVLAVVVMLLAANAVSRFVNDHPTVKMLALSFLLLLGMTLVAEGFGQHIPKGYIYFAMGFSIFVEGLNLRARAGQPVKFRRPPRKPAPQADPPGAPSA